MRGKQNLILLIDKQCSEFNANSPKCHYSVCFNSWLEHKAQLTICSNPSEREIKVSFLPSSPPSSLPSWVHLQQVAHQVHQEQGVRQGVQQRQQQLSQPLPSSFLFLQWP